MINYKKTILYEIYNDLNDIVFYGVTANRSAAAHLAFLKNDYKKKNLEIEKKNISLNKLYKLFDNIGYENIKIKTIDYLEFENKFDLNKYILNFIKNKKCLNNE